VTQSKIDALYATAMRAKQGSGLSRRELLAAGSLLAVAAGAPVIAQTPLTIRIGIASIGADNKPFVGGLNTAYAQTEKLIEKQFGEGAVNVEWNFFKGAGPAVNEAFANGQIDFAFQGDLPSLVGRANGLKTKILLATGAHQPTFVAVPSGSTVTSIKELRGKKVAYFRGTNNHLAAVKILTANGLTERDLQVLSLDNASQTAALAANQVDAVFGGRDLYFLQEKGSARIIYSTKGDDRAFERQGTFLVSEAFEQAQPDAVRKVVRAMAESARRSSNDADREGIFAYWAQSGIPVALFRFEYEGQSLNYRQSPLLDPFLEEQYRVLARQAKEFALVRRDVDVKGWFEPKYLEAALKELKLETFWQRIGVDGKPLGA
jgi:sulfonate transport system substrate-binding protein